MTVEVMIGAGGDGEGGPERNRGGVAVIESAARPREGAAEGGIAGEAGVAAEDEIGRGEEARGGVGAAVKQRLTGAVEDRAGADGAAGIQRQRAIVDGDCAGVVKRNEEVGGAGGELVVGAVGGVVERPDIAGEVVVEVRGGGVEEEGVVGD